MLTRLLGLILLFWVAGCAGGELGKTVQGPIQVVWEPEGPAWARVIALHGFNDRKAAFEGFGTFAAERGVIVEAYDQRGFGANADRGIWPGSDVLVADLRRRVRGHALMTPDLPVFVLGESMGAAVAVVAAGSPEGLDVDGLGLSAPAVWGGETMSPLYRWTLWLAARLAPRMTLSGRGLGIQASDNIEMLRDLGHDPLFIKESRVEAIEGLVRLMDETRAAGPRVTLPTLVLEGRKDEVVPPETIGSFADRLGADDCWHVTYEEGWHLLLRDLQRERVWKDIVAWMRDGTPLSDARRRCGGRTELAIDDRG